jgi:DNA-binding HxlR family transcriptional regulator
VLFPSLGQIARLRYGEDMAEEKILEASCSITRSLGVLGERWTFVILREAFDGTSRFADFRENLGIATNVLGDRLATLVEYGVMYREPYQEPGSRTRYAYFLTPAGRELHVVLGSLQQWGDKNLPWHDGPTIKRRVRQSRRSVHVAFVDDQGNEVPADDVAAIRTPAWHRAVPKQE